MAEVMPCTIEGCERPRRTPKSRWCNLHYFRWYRHGDPLVGNLASEWSISNGRRYTARYRADHPLASKHGRVYTHRLVLFDKIGYGPHRCHWCDQPLTWRVNLHVDHLDSRTDNNQPDNLVPTCRLCNVARGVHQKAIAAREAGWWTGRAVGTLKLGPNPFSAAS